MANRTPRFGFTTFDNPADRLSLHGYKAFGADRVLIDQILSLAVERHIHTGETVSATVPAAPDLDLSIIGGALPPNQPVYYRTSRVDARGQEHLASRPAVAYTPSQLTTPASPIVVRGPGAGTLPPGNYLYLVTAYTNDSSNETVASAPAATNLDVIGGFTVVLPRPPSSASGWNIYRRGPTDYDPMYVTAVSVDDTTFLDTGAVASRTRSLPARNTSSSSSSITITDADDFVAGETIKIYRTFDPTDWENSLLEWTAVLPYVDAGQPTRTGYPPDISAAVGAAPKVDLGDHTAGRPPPGLTHPPTQINFTFTGPVGVGIGAWQWVNEFEQLHLLDLRANLGRDSTAAEQPVIVALEYRAAGSATWLRFQTDVGPNDITAEILAGASRSNPTGLQPTDLPTPILSPGDALRPVVLQNGGGSDPTDFDLAITVTAAIAHGSETATYTWET